MGQAIHIFKKDVRHLRFEIAIAVTVAALFAFIETKHALWPVDLVNSRTLTSYLALLLLPVAWWMLIGRVVHDEALPGDRQFWLTRPYSWRSLLGAKLLFILAFVNLPMLIAQMVIVHAYGFSLGAELVGLVWSQVLLTIVFVLPILAISALTDGFVQLIAGSLTPCVIALAVFGLSVNFKPQFMLFGIAGGFANGHDWVRTYLIYLIITVAASAILFWQYSRRRTAIGRSFAAAAWILVGMVVYFISWNAASKIDYALSRTQIDISSVRLVSDLGAERRPAGFRQGGDYVGVHVPLQFAGLPSGTRTRIENLSMTFQVPDGTTWIADGFSWENPDPPDKQIFVQSGFFGAAYLTHNDVPVKVHGTIDLTVYGNPHTTQIPFGERSVPVAHVGLCSANENPNRQNDYFLVCNSAFRAPTALVSYRFVQPDEKSNDTNSLPMRNVSVPIRGELGVSALMNPQSMSFSPFPANLRISPVSQDFRHSWSPTPWDHAAVETLEPVGHVRFDFDIDLGKVPMYRSNNNEKIRP